MPKIVDHHACVTGYPHYDPEGVVCANDGDPDEEAYCSYDLGPSVCAYCKRRCPKGEMMIDGECCENPVDLWTFGYSCARSSPWYDQEGDVCATNDDDLDEHAYCSYDVGTNACAYCADNFPDTDGQLIVAQS